MTKPCSSGKIINPITNRCVNIDGKIGKALLSKRSPSKNNIYWTMGPHKGKSFNETYKNEPEYNKYILQQTRPRLEMKLYQQFLKTKLTFKKSPNKILQSSIIMESPIVKKEKALTIEHLYRVNLLVDHWKASVKGQKMIYEFQNCVERWILSAYIHRPKKGVFAKNIRSQPYTQTFWDQLDEKRIAHTGWDNDIKTYLFSNDINVDFQPFIKEGNVVLSSKLKVPIPKWLEDYEDEDLINLAIRYQILQAGSQHWAASDELFEDLIKKYDIDIEGFASPFNSYLIRSGLKQSEPDKYRIFTLFKDDKVFGCDTNFFSASISGHNVFVNPPFLESTLEQAAVHCLNALESDQQTTIVFYGPDWSDAAFYVKLKQSPYVVKHETLYRNTFSVMTATGELVSRVNNVLFVLSN